MRSEEQDTCNAAAIMQEEQAPTAYSPQVLAAYARAMLCPVLIERMCYAIFGPGADAAYALRRVWY